MKLLVLMLGIVSPGVAVSQVQPGSWELTVTSQMQGSGTGRLRQGSSSFEGDLDLAVDAGGGSNLGMRTKVSGRRLGPC